MISGEMALPVDMAMPVEIVLQFVRLQHVNAPRTARKFGKPGSPPTETSVEHSPVRFLWTSMP
eukprot:COSAG01_NODE_20095_length_970_cov_26.908152_2_plen_62_part_01